MSTVIEGVRLRKHGRMGVVRAVWLGNFGDDIVWLYVFVMVAGTSENYTLSPHDPLPSYLGTTWRTRKTTYATTWDYGGDANWTSINSTYSRISYPLYYYIQNTWLTWKTTYATTCDHGGVAKCTRLNTPHSSY